MMIDLRSWRSCFLALGVAELEELLVGGREQRTLALSKSAIRRSEQGVVEQVLGPLVEIGRGRQRSRASLEIVLGPAGIWPSGEQDLAADDQLRPVVGMEAREIGLGEVRAGPGAADRRPAPGVDRAGPSPRRRRGLPGVAAEFLGAVVGLDRAGVFDVDRSGSSPFLEGQVVDVVAVLTPMPEG